MTELSRRDAARDEAPTDPLDAARSSWWVLRRRNREGGGVRAEIEEHELLRFEDGLPVSAASAIAPLGAGWLIVQDDATHGAWRVGARTMRLRVFPPVQGLDVFSEAAGTKHLKPDLEAACPVTVAGSAGVLLLGSGATPARTRAALVSVGDDEPQVVVGDLAPVYAAVAAALGIAGTELNLEGSCRVGDKLRWFNRGNTRAGLPSASVDVDLAALLSVVTGAAPPDAVAVTVPRRYELGEVEGVGLAVTDAVALPDGRLLLSAAAEDTPNAVDDGPVVAAGLVLVEHDEVTDITRVPLVHGIVPKIEGLAVLAADTQAIRLLAVVDADDPEMPSMLLTVNVVV
jgi:hypothetical protein